MWHQQRTTEISSQSKYNCLSASDCTAKIKNYRIKICMFKCSGCLFYENSRAKQTVIICQRVREKSFCDVGDADVHVLLLSSDLHNVNTWWESRRWADPTDAERETRQEGNTGGNRHGVRHSLDWCDKMLPLPVWALLFTHRATVQIWSRAETISLLTDNSLKKK